MVGAEAATAAASPPNIISNPGRGRHSLLRPLFPRLLLLLQSRTRSAHFLQAANLLLPSSSLPPSWRPERPLAPSLKPTDAARTAVHARSFVPGDLRRREREGERGEGAAKKREERKETESERNRGRGGEGGVRSRPWRGRILERDLLAQWATAAALKTEAARRTRTKRAAFRGRFPVAFSFLSVDWKLEEEKPSCSFALRSSEVAARMTMMKGRLRKEATKALPLSFS